MAGPHYRRVLLKVSGEGFCPPAGFGIHREQLLATAQEIKSVADLGVEVSVVVGGGNLMRGASFSKELGIAAATADYIGMLGTVMNAIALQEALEQLGRETRVQSALTIARVCEAFVRRDTIRHMQKGRIVVLAGGTGNPHVTTDSCAALRSAELQVDLLLKATKVDGVYDKDPKKHADAKLYERLSYNQVIDERLKVMDISAIDICQQHSVPIAVFNLFQPGTMRRVVEGEHLGTFVDGG
jgi:uridylate kinase